MNASSKYLFSLEGKNWENRSFHWIWCEDAKELTPLNYKKRAADYFSYVSEFRKDLLMSEEFPNNLPKVSQQENIDLAA